MKRFAELFRRLDQSTATSDKLAALVEYFTHAPPADAAWGLWLLSGNKLGSARQKLAASGELRAWIADASGNAPWLVDECYQHVGDLAETLTLLLDEPASMSATSQAPAGATPEAPASAGPPARPDLPLSEWIEQRLLAVAGTDEATRRAAIEQGWRELPFEQRLVFNKLLTGNLRVGVSQGLVRQALASLGGIDVALIAQRLLGDWRPSPGFLARLLSPGAQAEDASRPYPFFLASPLEQAPGDLGPIEDWLAEWKWDGIRLQLIRRGGMTALWSRGDERLDGRFPEIESAARGLAEDAVIDGELVAWRDGVGPLPFGVLQTRIQRRKPGPKLLADAPVRLLAYDLLELQGEDLRARPLTERRDRLARLLEASSAPAPDVSLASDVSPALGMSPEVRAPDWTTAANLRESARERGVEGLMLKRRQSPYQWGRKRGDWWKWKIGPLTIDAVLIYAQAGHGRRSTLHTDYTFGLWDGDALVPVAKAYSGLSDAEILELDRWIRSHTLERFGPVRSVRPELVFELGFEGVNRSSRHKSGVAVRFPRILRWRRDKTAADADGLQGLLAQAC